MDARALTRELLLRYFGSVLALSEAIVLVVGGRRLLLRVTGTNSLDAEAQEERVAYHCFRGERVVSSGAEVSRGGPATSHGALPAATHTVRRSMQAVRPMHPPAVPMPLQACSRMIHRSTFTQQMSSRRLRPMVSSVNCIS